MKNDAIVEKGGFYHKLVKNLLNKFPIDFEYSNVPISGCSKNTFPSHLHCHHTTWVSVKNSQKVARFCVKTSHRSISRSSYNWMPKSISRKISGTKKIWIFHTHTVEKWKVYSHQNFFSSNQLFSNLFSKCVGFTKFLPKMGESKFP